MAELRWYQVSGNYASALTAATSSDEAVEIVRTSSWSFAFAGRYVRGELTDAPPGPPTAPGLYHAYAE